jgi:hypothetical protein
MPSSSTANTASGRSSQNRDEKPDRAGAPAPAPPENANPTPAQPPLADKQDEPE